MKKKAKTRSLFKYFSIFLLALGAIITLLFLFSKPAQAEAKELFTTYFDVDYVRQESAQILSEFLQIKENPNRVGAARKLGNLPPLSDPSGLLIKLKQNRDALNNAIAIIDAKEYKDPEVVAVHHEVLQYYRNLFVFEEKAISLIEGAIVNQTLGRVISTITEDSEYLPKIDQEDLALRASLAKLAEKYNINFVSKSYSEIHTARAIEMGSPIVSEDYSQVGYDFTVKESTTIQAVISISSMAPFSKGTTFTFIHPDGRQIAIPFVSDEEVIKSEYDKKSYGSVCGDSCAVFKLLPGDPSISSMAGNWKLIVKEKAGANLVFGFTEF